MASLGFNPLRHPFRWQFALLLMVMVVALGTLGYVTVAGMSLLEALYTTVMTVAMVGYDDNARNAVAGDPAAEARVMILNLVVIVFGIGTTAYAFSVVVRALFEGELRQAIGMRRLKRRVHFMRNHYVVCGCGRMGLEIAETLRARKIPVVLIEHDPARRVEVEELGFTVLEGDATDDQLLHDAAVEEARGLIAVTHSDPDNLFITISARQLNPDLLIVSRALTAGAEEKLLRAGANRVVQPYKIGARHLAQAALRPNVMDFLEVTTGASDQDIQLEEIHVPGGSSLVGKSLREATLLRELGLIVVGVMRGGKQSCMHFNPSADTEIQADDTLILIGPTEGLDRLEKGLRGQG